MDLKIQIFSEIFIYIYTPLKKYKTTLKNEENYIVFNKRHLNLK